MNIHKYLLISTSILALISHFSLAPHQTGSGAGFLISPVFAASIESGTIPTPDQIGFKQKAPIERESDLVNLITKIVQWTYTIFFAVAVIFILLAAFNYLKAGESGDKVKEVHKQLIWAAVAIAVALISVGANAIVKDFLGGTPGIPPGEKFVPAQFNNKE